MSMVKSGNVVITRTQFDLPTSYGYYYLSEVIRKAESLGFSVIDLSDELDTKEGLIDALVYSDPVLFIGMGHGSTTAFSGHLKEILIQAGVNSDWMSQRLSYLISCWTGAYLGPEIIKRGGLAYIGFNKRFWWAVDAEDPIPATDTYARDFFSVINSISFNILEGKTLRESLAAAESLIYEYITKWMDSDDDAAPAVIVSLLDLHDYITALDRETMSAELSAGLKFSLVGLTSAGLTFLL